MPGIAWPLQFSVVLIQFQNCLTSAIAEATSPWHHKSAQAGNALALAGDPCRCPRLSALLLGFGQFVQIEKSHGPVEIRVDIAHRIQPQRAFWLRSAFLPNCRLSVEFRQAQIWRQVRRVGGIRLRARFMCLIGLLLRGQNLPQHHPGRHVVRIFPYRSAYMLLGLGNSSSCGNHRTPCQYSLRAFPELQSGHANGRVREYPKASRACKIRLPVICGLEAAGPESVAASEWLCSGWSKRRGLSPTFDAPPFCFRRAPRVPPPPALRATKQRRLKSVVIEQREAERLPVVDHTGLPERLVLADLSPGPFPAERAARARDTLLTLNISPLFRVSSEILSSPYLPTELSRRPLSALSGCFNRGLRS